MNNLALNLPVNSTSFGNIGTSLLREVYNRGLAPSIFLIGQPDLSNQKPDNDFNMWLQSCTNKSFKVHKKNIPTVKLWHTNFDSLASFSNDEVFLSFIETDSITDIEQNILASKKAVLVTSNYLKSVCEEVGLNNVSYIDLGFDSYNFKKTNKKYFNDDRIVFNLLGKFEKRKAHKKVIQAWLKKYGVPKVGVKTRYYLQCSLYNQFLVQQQNGQIVDHNLAMFQDCLGGKEYGNIQFLSWIKENAAYNELLNSGNIVIGMGGGENFGAGEFHSVAMGSHAVILNANGFKDWATPANSVLIEPRSKIPSEDGIFFRNGGPLQQGNFFDFNEDEFIAGCEEAVKRYESNPLNVNGLELQKRTYKQTFDQILNAI